MKALLLTLFLLPFTVIAESDAEFTAKLIGAWTESRTPEPGKHHEQKIQLTPDGRFIVTGKEIVGGESHAFIFKGTWWVKDGLYGYKSTFSDPADVFPIGTSYADKIISVTSSEWIMEEASTGNKSIAKRMKE